MIAVNEALTERHRLAPNVVNVSTAGTRLYPNYTVGFTLKFHFNPNPQCIIPYIFPYRNIQAHFEHLEEKAIKIYGSLSVREVNLSSFYQEYDKLRLKIDDVKLILNINKTSKERALNRIVDKLGPLK